MPRLRRQSCQISDGAAAIDNPMLSTNARPAEEPVENQILDRATRTTVARSRTREDGGNIYRPEKVHYPIYEIKLGIHRINYLSRPMTEEAMWRKMPSLRLCVLLCDLALLGLVFCFVLLLRSLLTQLLAADANRITDE
ncbi:uncharacterized protein Z519_06634 [Cladophialophora bantiana CBS 173.52]|uniref:Uncharacterized protein n=1 Tax=Cladophialophora bantiana (strain ATCC 10958 / CBS 173.52 / CDC B-1940 / NIH 8579) TaxID=1442370 RepID=A0A0D2HPK9_CLAB1|nr:uncharacterized protein Z519_06634 [Cladophialophora bantiana CBS 173.52]KIW92785.1 hypothetical protein Z519_06634 [Cladophialophora bantiana CBS 173.52]